MFRSCLFLSQCEASCKSYLISIQSVQLLPRFLIWHVEASPAYDFGFESHPQSRGGSVTDIERGRGGGVPVRKAESYASKLTER